ncbi:hypothetical protein BDV95DRAFT_600365 [Massariosphaeria phaeospora]|uniref:PD-(D/E)XK nuclease-like domain-containing protein n=1 Tax=Massariosphaeria phaeospora TaxID=100035 RepID=A0A7C8M1E4_9PLEO|nr:hypothetical protein BDV95DRAFT_600365 [Massariosphaeria phaeospora]
MAKRTESSVKWLKDNTIFRKTDYCFAFFNFFPTHTSLYNQLDNAIISHTTDTATKHFALFSGIEVKGAIGNLETAQLQIAIWMAAALRKKSKMAHSSFKTIEQNATGQDLLKPDIETLIEPATTNVRSQHQLASQSYPPYTYGPYQSYHPYPPGSPRQISQPYLAGPPQQPHQLYPPTPPYSYGQPSYPYAFPHHSRSSDFTATY